jgi:septal ring factor EnvC (AmiA/AmiB activator)
MRAGAIHSSIEMRMTGGNPANEPLRAAAEYERAMPKAPEKKLVLELLREMRGDLAILRGRADEHSEELRTSRRQIHDWRETTATASGFAMHANIRGQELEQEIADLKKRVEKLEKAK